MIMKWINIIDKPPPKDRSFLAYVFFVSPVLIHIKGERKKEIQVCHWYEEKNNFCEACNCFGNDFSNANVAITHWMALPSIPKD